MSLTTVQRYQVARLPTVDGTLDNDDKYAFLGVFEPLSFEITSAQKKQLLRLPVVDAAVTTSDKFALLGLMEPVNPGGNVIEQFNVEWFIDPTFSQVPSSSDGLISIQLEGVIGGLVGTYVGPGPIALDRGFTPAALSITAGVRNTSIVGAERLFSMNESSAPASISVGSTKRQFAFSSGSKQLSIIVSKRATVIS